MNLSRLHQKILTDERATLDFGSRLARICRGGAIIFLYGDLGTGKTTLVRGILRGLGHEGVVKSPTFTLVEPYRCGDRWIYHFDLYRLADPEELDYIGVRDYFGMDALCLIEWPERGKGFLPSPDLAINLTYLEHGRGIDFDSLSNLGREIRSKL
ncbi:MAG: tRNA (adenosine(37)-N6)-threonylcarbamoyltransferase complex ATPase subunit type 1 TsaE [Gammaproteobacteria bacterium]|nr:tRNA (adenosine(37)-N6)-threonylcarbamoyltransferase complex ATPase subunit type 1 TsaE [Gammaproteobacteria bacterium]